MFRYRVQQYNPADVLVVTSIHEESTAFDSTVSYKIIRRSFKPFGPQGFQWFFSALAIVKECLSHIKHNGKFDFIEAARPFPEGVAAIILKLLTRKKCIINYHGEDINVMSNYRIENKVLSIMASIGDILLCNSTFTSSLLQKLYPQSFKKVHVVPPGFYPTGREALDADKIRQLRMSYKRSPILITVARICERKGQDTVIKALPLLVKDYPEILYIIAGSYDTTSSINEVERLQHLAAAQGVSNHIKFITNFSDDERPYLLAASDIFVMPNRILSSGEIEGYGIVFLEASYLKLPVIGGRNGGVPDAILDQKSGLLVDGNNPVELTNALKLLLEDNKQKVAFGEAGYEYASKLTFVDVHKKYTAICSATVNSET